MPETGFSTSTYGAMVARLNDLIGFGAEAFVKYTMVVTMLLF